jgi:hypothetical protein
MNENESKLVKELIPAWAMYAALSYQVDHDKLTPEYKKSCLEQLDKLHEGLLEVTEAIEKLSDRIQMSIHKAGTADAGSEKS